MFIDSSAWRPQGRLLQFFFGGVINAFCRKGFQPVFFYIIKK